jgi:hypothetical protein
VEVSNSGWFGLRATTDSPVYPIDDSRLHAETSAVYVYVGDLPIRSREDAEYFLTWLDAIEQQATDHPGWRSDAERDHVLGQIASAREVFRQRAAEDQ